MQVSLQADKLQFWENEGSDWEPKFQSHISHEMDFWLSSCQY